MKLTKLFVPIFVSLIILTVVAAPSITVAETLSDKILRLHILANSDSVYDQNIKLELKDYFIENSKDIFTGDNIEENIILAEKNKIRLEKICNDFLTEKKYNLRAEVSICREFFSTRVYDDFTLPAGVYNAIKIEIGRGEGHNWWCIVFPSVCLASCSETMQEYLSEDELELVKSGFSPKFKIIEIYEKIKEKIVNTENK